MARERDSETPALVSPQESGIIGWRPVLPCLCKVLCMFKTVGIRNPVHRYKHHQITASRPWHADIIHAFRYVHTTTTQTPPLTKPGQPSASMTSTTTRQRRQLPPATGDNDAATSTSHQRLRQRRGNHQWQPWPHSTAMAMALAPALSSEDDQSKLQLI